MTKCPKCKQIKPESEIYKNPRRKNGLTCYCKICTNAINKNYQTNHKEKCAEYRNEYAKQDYHKHPEKYKLRNKTTHAQIKIKRDALVLQAKQCGCVLCGNLFCSCLVFHHLHDKDTEISKIKTARSVLLEISKCIVLCANCHLLLHAGKIKLPDNIRCIDTKPLEHLT